MADRQTRMGPGAGTRAVAQSPSPRPNRGPRESPEELARKVTALEKARKEDAKDKDKKEKEKKREMQAAKKKINTELALTRSDVRKQEMGINKLQTQLSRLDTSKDSTQNKKVAQIQKMDQLLNKNYEAHNSTESQLADKMSKVGMAKGRLSHLEFAQAMLEKGVIIDITNPDPRFQPALSDKSRSGVGPDGRLLALQDNEIEKSDVNTLRDQLERLQAENDKLKKLVDVSGPAVYTLDEQGVDGTESSMPLQNPGNAAVRAVSASTQGSPLPSASSSHVDIGRCRGGQAYTGGGRLAASVQSIQSNDSRPTTTPARAYSMPPTYDARTTSPMVMRASYPNAVATSTSGTVQGGIPAAFISRPTEVMLPGGRFPSIAGTVARPAMAVPLRPGTAGSMANLPSYFDQRTTAVAASPRPVYTSVAALGAEYQQPMVAGYAGQTIGADVKVMPVAAGAKPAWAQAFANASSGSAYRAGIAEPTTGGTPSLRTRPMEPRVPSSRPAGGYPTYAQAVSQPANQFTPRTSSGLSDTWLLRGAQKGDNSEASILTSDAYQFPASTAASTSAGAGTDLAGSGSTVKEEKKGANHFRKVVAEVTGRALREYRERHAKGGADDGEPMLA